MSTDSFLEMLRQTEVKPAEIMVDNSYAIDIILAYDLLYDRKNHGNTVQKVYKHIVERPPTMINVTEAAKSYLLSLTEAELKLVMKDLKQQMPASPATRKKINVVEEFKKLDEMAQYKFFCSVRDMYDDEDWQTLTN